jgi:beta-aspartyl-peptidase (threonine type)
VAQARTTWTVSRDPPNELMLDQTPTGSGWRIVVHGGAKTISDAETPNYRRGCERAAVAGSAILDSGGTAVDAVVAAIRVLEDDPTFNAGNGAVSNSDGYPELDAAIMDGRTLDVGAVAALRDSRNPILTAHAMLREEETLLVADGARRFAEAHTPGTLLEPDSTLPTSNGGDTVGCVALDQYGNIASGTSTGGLAGSPPGRVGDSPLPGCGFYAENGFGAVALSGAGERISRVTLAAWVMASLRHSDVVSAARAALVRLEKVDGEGGIILIDGEGHIGWAHNSRDFAVAHATSSTPVASFTRATRNQPQEEMRPHS